MENPVIQTDLAEILKEIKSDQKKLLDEVNDLKLGQSEIKGEIKALNTNVEQLDKRIGNSELTNRGVLIGLIVVILGGAAKFFGIVGNP
jgi:predicted  nucleic acid-binding Zn-ribbon protein